MTYENETTYADFLEFAAAIDRLAIPRTEGRIWNMAKAGIISCDVADSMTNGHRYAYAFGEELLQDTQLDFTVDLVPGCTYCSRILEKDATVCKTCNEYKGVTTWSEMYDLEILGDFIEMYVRRHFAIMDGVGA